MFLDTWPRGKAALAGVGTWSWGQWSRLRVHSHPVAMLVIFFPLERQPLVHGVSQGLEIGCMLVGASTW